MTRDTVLRVGWWQDARVQALPAEARLVLLALAALADRDGVAELASSQLVVTVGGTRAQVVASVLAAEAAGLLGRWQHDGRAWVWLVRHASDQPHSGALALPRCADRPAPARELVLALLSQQLGRTATAADGRRACPRAWGLVREPAGVAASDVGLVWEAWRARQARPASCHLSDAVQRLIRTALAGATAEQLGQLVEYAYDADEPAARFWRGQNDHRRTYLGLDNLLRAAKLADRLQLVGDWLEQRRPTDGGDGTDLGPLARYRRRGPAGTQTTPDPRPVRLSAQCAALLALFVQRGEAGVRTSELASVALKYTGRISEMRGEGADIVVMERSEDGDNLYVLLNAEAFSSRLAVGADNELD